VSFFEIVKEGVVKNKEETVGGTFIKLLLSKLESDSIN